MKFKLKNIATMLTNEAIFKLIDPHTEIVVIAPWNGKPIPITIKILDSVALTSCGDFNLVTNILTNVDYEPTQDDAINIKNIHENMLRLCLIHPTFKEFEEHMIEKDFYKQKKEEIAEIKDMIAKVQSEVKKEEFNEVLLRLELAIAFLIPEDFTAFIITILLQREATDLNKLTKETLLKAGFLGEKYNIRPSEYLDGIFTAKQKVDIDITALTLVSDYRDEQKIEKSGVKWIRGKNAN